MTLEPMTPEQKQAYELALRLMLERDDEARALLVLNEAMSADESERLSLLMLLAVAACSIARLAVDDTGRREQLQMQLHEMELGDD